MSVNWQHWSGRTIDRDIQLQDYLGGSDSSAIFSTSYSGQKAVVRLFLAQPDGIENQVAHLKLTESLSHPHLLKVLRSGRAQADGVDLAYAVKEYAEENLWQVIPQRALTPAEAKEVLRGTTEALAYLHSQRLVHGDVKPGNIMAVGDQVKLGVDDVRRSGEPLGRPTQPHDAPEAPKAVSPASDSWSLGMTLVEILTQKLPSWNPNDNLPPTVSESVPAPFREIAQHCMLRTPELRWSMKDVAERLSAEQTKSTPAAAMSESATPVVKAPVRPAEAANRSSRAPLILGAVSLALLVLVIAIGHNRGPEPSQPQATEGPAQPATSSSTTDVTGNEPKHRPTENSSPGSSTATKLGDANGRNPADNDEEVNDTVRDVTPTSATRKAETRESSPGEPGNTVTRSSGAGGVVHEQLPTVSPRALQTITGKVRVKVRVAVDSAGNVVGSDFVNPGPSKYFANAAMQAAKNWKFAPEQAQSRAWNLQFEFRRSEVKASSTPANQ